MVCDATQPASFQLELAPLWFFQFPMAQQTTTRIRKVFRPGARKFSLACPILRIDRSNAGDIFRLTPGGKQSRIVRVKYFRRDPLARLISDGLQEFSRAIILSFEYAINLIPDRH